VVSRPAFIINNRNKGKFVYRCVAAALAQTVPCDIFVADFASTDDSRSEIERAVKEAPRAAQHKIEYWENDEPTKASMIAVNRAIAWMVERLPNEWIFQCSSDDYSLPDRVRMCLQAAAKNDCAGVGCTMRFEAPGRPEHGAVSGYPTESGYVSGGIGIHKMAYGSTIWAYRREFLLKVGLDVPCTLDVYLGYLASMDRGYYVVADPQHVHYMAADNENIGFQGKMRAAEASGDRAMIDRINELNRFQLFELYFLTKLKQQDLYPMAHAEDQNALVGMLLAQASGWYQERVRLHANGITPGVLS
jgi:glycosyltransferase involved in cell wall biosynthesis